MKKLLLILIPLLITSSCSDDCQEQLDQIQEAKQVYLNSPTSGNCLAYQNLLQTHLNSSCESSTQGVDYDVLFQDELDNLQCGSLPGAISTCANGVQDAGETGVDCGGACQPCGTTATCSDGIQNGNETGVDCGGACAPCSTFFMSCEIDGSAWDAFMQGSFSAALDTNGFIKGYLDGSGQGQIQISNSDDMQQTGVYSFTESNLSAGEAKFLHVEFDSNTSSFKQYKAVGTNGTLEITDINTTNGTISGTFSLEAYQNNVMPSDTIMVTNGTFFLPISN